jgi:DNA-binding NarL/FixJ family response regulator
VTPQGQPGQATESGFRAVRGGRQFRWPQASFGAGIEPVDDANHAQLLDLLRGARREVLVTVARSTPYLSARVVEAVRAQVCGPQLRVRMLWSSCDRSERCSIPEMIRHRVQVKIAGEVAHESLLIDGRLAVVPQDLGRPADVLLAVTTPSLVDAMLELFARHWATAAQAAVICVPPDEFEQSVLRSLVAGLTDEVIAGRLGVSARTVRRHVSVLMNRAGARSRFEFGFRAAELGWLAPEPPPGAPDPGGAGQGGPWPAPSAQACRGCQGCATAVGEPAGPAARPGPAAPR